MQAEQLVNSGRQWVRPGLRAIAMLAASLVFSAALPASAATLDRIKETGHIKFGYGVDVRPFTFHNEAGKPDGYGVTLCQQVAERVKQQLDIADLTVDWVPVTIENAETQVQQGSVDLICTPATETLTRRSNVSFSIPIFPGGTRAVIRKDAAQGLREALGDNPNPRPLWRGSPATKVLEKKVFAVVPLTTSASWLAGKIDSFQIDARTVSVANYREGVQMLLDRKVDVLFGERAAVLGAMDSAARDNLVILDRLLTQEPRSFVLARGDEDFRLLVDRALSKSYASAEFGELYAKWFGDFNDKTRTFFLWMAVTP